MHQLVRRGVRVQPFAGGQKVVHLAAKLRGQIVRNDGLFAGECRLDMWGKGIKQRRVARKVHIGSEQGLYIGIGQCCLQLRAISDGQRFQGIGEFAVGGHVTFRILCILL